MKTITVILLLMIAMTDEPRKVLLFYTNGRENTWKMQMKAFDNAKEGIRERDINVVSIPFSEERAGEWKKWNVDRSEPFTFILVGRDGGEKHRSNEVVKVEKLFALIDAMPMRRSEMKNGR